MPARRRHRTIMSFTPAGVTGTNAIARRLVFHPATPNISAIRRPCRWQILAEVFYGTQTHTHPFNGPFSGTIRVSRYQKGKTNLDFTEARDSEWQWHQLGHMQVRISLQTDNHASTPPLSFYRPDALPAAQPTASKH